jgi:hypothetical protein
MLHGQGHERKQGISPILPRFMARESTPTKEENISNVNTKEKKKDFEESVHSSMLHTLG